MEKLTGQQILDARLDDWRKLAQALHARFLTRNFVTGLAFVTAVTEAAEEAGHHPDLTLTYPFVDARLLTHDVSAVTRRDVDLARRISEIARERGIVPGLDGFALFCFLVAVAIEPLGPAAGLGLATAGALLVALIVAKTGSARRR